MSSEKISHLVLRKKIVEDDWKLKKPREINNGRKVLVNDIYQKTELRAQEPEWEFGPETGKTPVIETGIGGIEVATFTHEAGQDCHKHIIATEIYTVLKGTMLMRINEKDPPLALEAGDEVIVLPNTVHEVLPDDTSFLTRVHAIDCYGDRDKYVKRNGEWCQVLTLKKIDTNKPE